MISITALFDESGKFADRSVVAFGGVACPAIDIKTFSQEWEMCLRVSGLNSLTMKEALRHAVPLSERLPALGAQDRTEALLPFVACVRKHLQAITGMAVDVNAFKSLPSHYFQILGNDPFFTAFLRVLIEILSLTHDDDKITVICDDEEAMALPMYKFYRRVKLIDPSVRNKLKGLCFADDEYLYALQSADLVSSLIKMEAGKKFHGTPYDYERLFAALTAQPDRSTEKIWVCNIAFGDKQQLGNLAEDLKRQKEKKQ